MYDEESHKDPQQRSCDRYGTVPADGVGKREEKELQININLMYFAIYIGDQTPYLEKLSLCFRFL